MTFSKLTKLLPKYSRSLAGALGLVGLYILSRYNYLLFHSLAEIFSIVIACGIFMVAWNCRKFSDNHYLLFLGIAYLFVGGIDLLHALSYKGMAIFPGTGANQPTQLWISARYLESASLLIAPVFLTRRLQPGLAFSGYALLSGLLVLSIFYLPVFPDCFIEGVGLTPFKKVSEYLIALMLLAAIGLLLRQREKFERDILRLLLISIVITIGSELAFTFYISVYGLSNLVGHLFKITSFYLIYLAIIATSLVRPYDLLFRSLRQNEEKFRSLYAAMNEGVCLHEVIYDGEGKAVDYRIMDVNPAYESILGIKREDALQRRASELYGAGEPYFLERYADVAATGQSTLFESYLPTMGKHFRISAFSPGKGTFATVFADITERKQAEEALKRSNLKLELLSATARQLLTSDQPEQIVQSICEKVMAHLDCHAFFNYLIDEGEQRLHLNAFAGIPAEVAKEIEWLDFGGAVCGCVARDGNKIIAEDIQRKPDERTALVHSFGIRSYACHPLLYQGRVIGTLSFGTCNRPRFTEQELSLMKTVTDQVATAMARKQTEEHIKALNEELKRNVNELAAANKELEAFSYSVSHDLRAPLRSIAGFSQALLEDHGEVLDAEGRDFLARILAAMKRMGQLIDDLLDLSRVSRAEMRREAVDLSSMAAEIAGRLQKAQPERQVEFAIAEGLSATGDGRLLHVVLENLLGNAWKFTAKRTEAKIELGTKHLDGRDVYYVKDNGAGFDKTYAAKLFAPFQRLHNPRNFPGTGIGLATVMRIIRRHGGEAWIEGKEGKGATAYFTTPG